MTRSRVSRREFLGSAAAMAASVTIVPRHVLGGEAGPAPSDKLNIACVGVGGRAGAHVSAAADQQNLYAICDVDSARLADVGKVVETYYAEQF